MMTRPRTKAKAMPRVPQTREDAVFAIGRIGHLRRTIASHKAAADDAIKEIGQAFEAQTEALKEELGQHEQGVQVWCEANRAELTSGNKVKFHNFGTGRINWRSRPPRVTIRGIEAVIEACKQMGLASFLRERIEINKDAMLADPDKARMVAGVSVSSEGEDFIIEPAEIEVSVSAGPGVS